MTPQPPVLTDTRHPFARRMQAIRAAAAGRLAAYLKRRRSRFILGCFLACSALLVAFSGVDIRISGLFYDDGFRLAGHGWTEWLHQGVGNFLYLSMISVVAVYAVNRITKRSLCGIDGRTVVYLFLVLIVGAGLIVNVAFKDHFGRARPRDIVEFGGTERFTPAFVISSACERNCSFSSGDSSGAFFSLAFILASRRKRALAAAGVGYGILVSVARIAAGAHFFSDTVVSFFVMLIVADSLHYLMFAPGPGAVRDAAERPAGTSIHGD
jgi:lipid A 4'-phosphatase